MLCVLAGACVLRFGSLSDTRPLVPCGCAVRCLWRLPSLYAIDVRPRRLLVRSNVDPVARYASCVELTNTFANPRGLRIKLGCQALVRSELATVIVWHFAHPPALPSGEARKAASSRFTKRTRGMLGTTRFRLRRVASVADRPGGPPCGGDYGCKTEPDRDLGTYMPSDSAAPDFCSGSSHTLLLIAEHSCCGIGNSRGAVVRDPELG